MRGLSMKGVNTRLVLLLLCLLFANIFFSLRTTQDTSTAHPPFQLRSEVEVRKTKEEEVVDKQLVKSKLILAYTTIYGRPFNVSTYGRVGYELVKNPNPLTKCEYKCEWSTNKSDYDKSDAIIFHLYNNLQNKDFSLKNLPTRRNKKQKWVFMAREPQAFYYPNQLTHLKDMFNLTMTFQSDSDISIPYGGYWQHPPTSIERRRTMKLDYLSGKDKMVAWLASNCRTSSRREDFVKELQKYMHIDVFGKCGNLTTNIKSANGFRDKIAREYKFYIAFENSDCDDYISEKFWNSLHIGLIPIVRGQRARYKNVAPPNSYIHVDSFLSPEALVKHLKEITSNSSMFHSYHEWRRLYDANYKFFTINTNWMCELCQKVHTSKQQTVDIYNHFSEDTRCFTYLDHKGRNRTGEHMEDIERA